MLTAVVLSLVGCGGGRSASSALPSSGSGGAGGGLGGAGNTTVATVIPPTASVSSASSTRKAQYITAQTAGIIVYSWTGAHPPNPAPVAEADWSSSSPLCKPATPAPGRLCSATFDAPISAGNTTVVVDVYDHAPAACASNGYCSGGPASGAHLISIGVSAGQTISANGVNQITVQTFGVLASIQIAAVSGAVTATGLDADGNAIGGACLDGSTPLAVTPVTNMTLSAFGFSFTGNGIFSSASCTVAGLSAGTSTGFITAAAASAKGTLPGVGGYDVIVGGNGSSGPVAIQTISSAGGTISLTPSNSTTNGSSNFGGGSFCFTVPAGAVSGATTFTIAEVAAPTLNDFIPAGTLRRPQYTSGGGSNPNIVVYGFALAVGAGVTSSLSIGCTLQVTNGTLADALGANGTLFIAADTGTATIRDAGSLSYRFYSANAMLSDSTGSCAAAGIDTNCLVLGTFTPAAGVGISAPGVYLIYLPAAVLVDGSNDYSLTLSSPGAQTLTVSQPGPSGAVFSAISDPAAPCSQIASLPSTTFAGSFSVTPVTTVGGSCKFFVESSAGGQPATVTVTVLGTSNVTVSFGAPQGSNYTSSVKWAAGPYLVIGRGDTHNPANAATVSITITSNAQAVPLSLSLSNQSPSGAFSLSGTGPWSLSYTGAVTTNRTASATLVLSTPPGFSLNVALDPNSGMSATHLSFRNDGGSSSTLTVEATCLSNADDAADEGLPIDLTSDLSGCN